MPDAPTSLTIHQYQVGFGDCYLLSFHYGAPGAKDRNVLIDFGSKYAPRKLAMKALMKRVADDIAQVCAPSRLHAVVLSHRHQDHLSGFARGKNRDGPGEVIRNLRPKVVIQPWTEHPDAERDAEVPPGIRVQHRAFTNRLERMHEVADAAVAEANHLLATEGTSGRWRGLFSALRFLGEEGIKNADAVGNLMDMAEENYYVHHGSRSGLETILPGVKVTVLGPPTLEQSQEILKERRDDVDQFWLQQALAGRRVANRKGRLFPEAETSDLSNPPSYARWIIPRLRRIRGEGLLEIVRIIDDALNNTSVILLFEVKGTALLFPGDAQIENWEYALGKTALVQRLARVDVYKVGHHGSRNATPKSLWNRFENRGDKTKPGRLMTLISTLGGKYGKAGGHGEVPRRTLMKALRQDSDCRSTQAIKRVKQTIELDL